MPLLHTKVLNHLVSLISPSLVIFWLGIFDVKSNFMMVDSWVSARQGYSHRWWGSSAIPRLDSLLISSLVSFDPYRVKIHIYKRKINRLNAQFVLVFLCRFFLPKISLSLCSLSPPSSKINMAHPKTFSWFPGNLLTTARKYAENVLQCYVPELTWKNQL